MDKWHDHLRSYGRSGHQHFSCRVGLLIGVNVWQRDLARMINSTVGSCSGAPLPRCGLHEVGLTLRSEHSGTVACGHGSVSGPSFSSPPWSAVAWSPSSTVIPTS